MDDPQQRIAELEQQLAQQKRIAELERQLAEAKAAAGGDQAVEQPPPVSAAQMGVIDEHARRPVFLEPGVRTANVAPQRKRGGRAGSARSSRCWAG